MVRPLLFRQILRRIGDKNALISCFYDGLTRSCKTFYGVIAAQMPLYAVSVVHTIYFILEIISAFSVDARALIRGPPKAPPRGLDQGRYKLLGWVQGMSLHVFGEKKYRKLTSTIGQKVLHSTVFQVRRLCHAEQCIERPSG